MEIKFENVTYKKILNKLSFEIKNSDITSIIGKNNSGKTTVLDLIYGILLPDSGKVNITLPYNSEKTNIKNELFYLSSDYENQLFNINIYEDIKYGIKNIDNEKLYELLKMFELNSNILNKSYLEISNSEKQKIVLISMLLSDKRVLLLDNPTSNLDYKSKQTLIKLLKLEKRNDNKKIIIITSNDTNFLLGISDRIIVLDSGEIIADDNKYNILGNKDLLKKIHIEMPNIINFKNKVSKNKNINLIYRDNLNDLIKDIYRNAR